ncbi:Schwannomin-interacting protein 1 [Trichinella spiralis]|uniref:Schwannomin-interacting protein 1 n=3 Tax=Trichinella TaxID=6333 RepID=A0A0V1BL44_TRISP|nr:Schwannomin-interacting protein 1 [Trichinella spiralis]
MIDLNECVDLNAEGVDIKNNNRIQDKQMVSCMTESGTSEMVTHGQRGCALDSARRFTEAFDECDSSCSVRRSSSIEDEEKSAFSHASSLESAPHTDLPSDRIASDGGEVFDGDSSSLGSSISCSEGSFILTNGDDASATANQCFHEEPELAAVNCRHIEEAKDLGQCLSSICNDLNSIDTLLPVVDFEKLEKDWVQAAKDVNTNQRRKIMSEEVRRRLAMEEPDEPYWCNSKRQFNRFTLSSRLQSAMKLQVCFINDDMLCEENDGDDKVVDDGVIPKSVSEPNFTSAQFFDVDVNNLQQADSETGELSSQLSASELRRKSCAEQENGTFMARQKRLEFEATMLFMKAKETARMQMEVERQARQKNSLIDNLIGFPISCQKKLSRSQLTAMSTTRLQIILNDIHSKINALNEELVQLLMQRDSLHMEQDSMLVDIADFLQHQCNQKSLLTGESCTESKSKGKKYNRLLKMFRR